MASTILPKTQFNPSHQLVYRPEAVPKDYWNRPLLQTVLKWVPVNELAKVILGYVGDTFSSIPLDTTSFLLNRLGSAPKDQCRFYAVSINGKHFFLDYDTTKTRKPQGVSTLSFNDPSSSEPILSIEEVPPNHSRNSPYTEFMYFSTVAHPKIPGNDSHVVLDVRRQYRIVGNFPPNTFLKIYAKIQPPAEWKLVNEQNLSPLLDKPEEMKSSKEESPVEEFSV